MWRHTDLDLHVVLKEYFMFPFASQVFASNYEHIPPVFRAASASSVHPPALVNRPFSLCLSLGPQVPAG